MEQIKLKEVRYQVWDQVGDQVRYQVMNQVYNQVWIQVRNQTNFKILNKDLWKKLN